MGGKAHAGYLPNASTAQNQMTGMGYDAAGNMTSYTAPNQFAREVLALDDIEAATGIRPNFVPYNIGEPNFGIPELNVTPGTGLMRGEGEVKLDVDIFPE
jgi:hypothetical protein